MTQVPKSSREFWIDPLSAENNVTPWKDHPVAYQKFNCVNLPGGFWPDRAIHVIEISALDELLAGLREVEDAINDIPQDCDRRKPLKLISDLLSKYESKEGKSNG